MKSISVLLLTAVIFVFTQCGGAKKEEVADHEHDHAKHEEPVSTESEIAAAGAPQFTVDAAFQKQLSDVFVAYVALKEAFVASDPAKVKTEASATLKSLASADMKLLTGAAHNDWMTYLGGLEGALKKIEASTDIEDQRKAFVDVTDSLYKSIKAFGLGGATAYYEFCPMAFDNQGAYWLSNEEKIRNPYFGDKMLTCGNVQEKLQ